MNTLERIASYGTIVGFLFISSGCAVEPDHQYGGDRDRDARYQDRYQDPRYQDPRYQDRYPRNERDRHGRDHEEHHCDNHEHGEDCRDRSD